jgi:hypothetical protein
MASSDNGGQVITFKFQQEATAQGFNKLLNGVIPTGVISGGDLSKVDNITVNIDRMEMMIGDGNVTVHVQTTELARVNVNTTHPYIVATYNWANLANNFVTFEAYSSNQIPLQNAIILGKCQFVGDTLLERFDYTRKTWSSIYLNNSFLYDNAYRTKSPSFNVSYIENSDTLNIIGFNVGAGEAIINGKRLVLDNEMQVILTDNDSGYHRIVKQVINGRVDIAVLMNDGNVRYIMGEDTINPKPPTYPSYGLVIAEFIYDGGDNINYILGSKIKNIYNNNYMNFAPTFGIKNGTSTINEHTLYL